MNYSDFNALDYGGSSNSSDNMATPYGDGRGIYDFSPYGQDFNYNTGTIGGDNDTPRYDMQGMQDWLGDNNYSLRETPDQYSNSTLRGLFSNTTNAPVDPTITPTGYGGSSAIQTFNNDDQVFKMASLAAAGLINPAFIGTQLGATGLGASALGGGIMGTNAALFNGAKTLKDVGMGALTGAAGAGIGKINPAEYFGVTNPIASRALNGATRAGISAGMGGGDPVRAALSGGLVGGLNGMSAGSLSSGTGSIDDLPGTIGGNIDMAEGIGQGEPMSPALTESNMQTAGLDPTAFAGTPLERSYAQSATGRESAPQSNTITDIFSNGIPTPFGGRVGLGDFAGGLMGLYQAYDQRKRAKNLAGQLAGNYGPNSAYAQRLRSELQRRDAAGGRRSQYGPREVDFQAKMAGLNAQMAPTLSNLDQQVGNSNWTMANSILNLGHLFGKGPDKVSSQQLPTLQQPMAKPNYSLGNPNATLSGINPEWLKSLSYGG